MDYGHSICDNPDCRHPYFFHGVYGCLGKGKDKFKVFCTCKRDLNNQRGSAIHGKLRVFLEKFGLIETEDWFKPETPTEIEPLPKHELDAPKYSIIPPDIRNKLYYPEDFAFELPGAGVYTADVNGVYQACSMEQKPEQEPDTSKPHFVRAIDLLH